MTLPGRADRAGSPWSSSAAGRWPRWSYHPSLREEPSWSRRSAPRPRSRWRTAGCEAELRARLQDLHGVPLRLVDAAQDERRRLERDLHDGAQQRLVALSLELACSRAG